MIVDQLRVVKEWDPSVWPFTIPAVNAIARDGLRLDSDIVVLLGANGSGKSTIIEAIAEAYGIDVRGGHGARRYGSNIPKGQFGEVLDLVHTDAGRRFKRQGATGFFLRAETAAGMLDFMTSVGIAGYGERPAAVVSHGESYLQAITGRFNAPGLYLLDEAEGPLSFESTLTLLQILRQVVTEHEAQVVYATHSPLVAAIPMAQVFELTDEGIELREWDDLQTVNLWRAFLDHPGRFFSDAS